MKNNIKWHESGTKTNLIFHKLSYTNTNKRKAKCGVLFTDGPAIFSGFWKDVNCMECLKLKSQKRIRNVLFR